MRVHGEFFNRYVHMRLHAKLEDVTRGLRGERVVDVGCGGQPYRYLFTGFTSYVGVDRPDRPDAGGRHAVAGDATALPLVSGCADAVLATEVLEHVAEPASALAEFHRLLRDDGVLLLSTPFCWHLHDEPYDYWRFTPHSLRLLLDRAGFDVERLEAVNGYAGALVQSSCYVVVRRAGRFVPLTWPLVWLAQKWAVVADRLLPNPLSTNNFVVRARRRSS